jgi:ubiquinol-cytochrome c reductase cytochrome c subunit
VKGVVPGLLVAVALAVGLGSFHRVTAAAAQAADPATVAAGHALFVTGCSTCHGADGSGIAHRGPSLVNAGAAAADFYLRTGRMPLANPDQQPLRGPAAYDSHQIGQLVAFVASLGHGPPVPVVAPGDLQAGNSVFQLNCAACHSVVGAGGALSYGNVVPSLDRATRTDVAEAVRVGPGNMPKFSTQVLTDQQAADVATYVQYLHHPQDRGGFGLGHLGPIPEGFVGLVLGLGALLLCVRLIGTRA